MEMHLLLTPISIAVLCTLTMFVVMGIPHSLNFFANAQRDLPALTHIVALVLALFPLWTAWTLGVTTLRGERYDFDEGFWMALAASALAAHIGFALISPMSLACLAPMWLFIAHMSALQLRLRVTSARIRKPGPVRPSALGLP